MTAQILVEPSIPSTGSSILVSGASFAGLATAYWMSTLGYRVTVVEIASELRKGGTPVDIEGETIEVLKRMGIIDAVRAKALPPRELQFKDANDDTVGLLGGPPDPEDGRHERFEIHRSDLLAILFACVEGLVEIKFGQSIKHLENTRERVSVGFADDSRCDYGLVIGCDGNRSHTRRLAFGKVDEFSYFMGGYFFIKVVPTTGLLPANTSQLFSVPGRTALLNGYIDQTDIVFAFRTDREINYEYQDRTQQRRMLHDHFDGLGWKVPQMLNQVDANEEFYFDKLSQIRMPMWSTGRIALVGDAGYCVSPVAGMGGSMAIIGAARLADALRRHGLDHNAAFQDYHDNLRPVINEVQEMAATQGMALMFPSNVAEIAERDRKLKHGIVDL